MNPIEKLPLFENRAPAPPDPGGGVPDRGGRRTATVLQLGPRSRTTDPATSHQAAESMVDEAQAQRQAILAYLKQHPAGLCADRLDEALGFRDGRSGKRCPELCEQGLAVLCDGTEKVIGGKKYHIPELRQQTRSKRWGCIVLAVEHLDPSWRLTGK